MPDVRFDTYCRYEDLTRILQEYAEEAPNLRRLESREELGQLEGRACKPSSPGGFSPYDATDERAGTVTAEVRLV